MIDDGLIDEVISNFSNLSPKVPHKNSSHYESIGSLHSERPIKEIKQKTGRYIERLSELSCSLELIHDM